jgi:hypothetical protein
MVWNPTMLQRAQDLLRGQATDDPAAFKARLAAEGMRCLQEDGAGIEWWNSPPLARAGLVALVQAGVGQAHCKALTTDFLRALPASTQSDIVDVKAEFDRSGWLKYYLYEAANMRQSLGPADQRMLADIMNALYFQANASGSFGEKLGPSLRQPLEVIDDKLLQGILFELMTMGFERIPATQQAAVAGSASNAAIIGKMLWAGDAGEVQGTTIKVQKIKAKWRADSRPHEEIRKSSGFATKAQSEGYAAYANLSAPWHPLASEFGKRWLWFRKFSSDNCLYSVVSVGKAGKDHMAYLPYPLIKLSGGTVAGVRGYQGEREVLCRPVRGGTPVKLALPVSVTYLYYFVFAGLALDTGAMQGKDAYPEVGVASIPFNNVVGAVKVTRFHLGPKDSVSDDDGVLCVYRQEARNDDNLLSVKASYGEQLYTKMCQRFDAVAQRATADAVKWASTGAGYVDLGGLNAEFDYGGARYKVATLPAV